MNPLVSVVIPAFNAGAFIGEALESVRAQSYRPLEVIVVDDGSTDDTGAVVERFAAKAVTDCEVQCISQQNGGPSKARNTGIKAARGGWIAFLDADDIWTEDKLTKQMDYVKGHENVALIFGDMRIFGDEGIITPSAYGKYGYPACDSEGMLLDGFKRLVESNPIYTGTVVARRDCFDKAGLFDESIRHGEDYDMWLRLALSYGFACMPHVMMARRKHGENLSAGEEHFYTSKLYILEKLQGNSLVGGTRLGMLRDSYLATKKELSYLFYLRKRYARAVAALLDYCFSFVRITLLGLPLRGNARPGQVTVNG